MSTVEGKKQEKRRALLDAAYELFLERGTAKTSVEDITSRAKVGKGTFYLYFQDKGAVMQALLGRVSYQLLSDACLAVEQHPELPDFTAQVVFVIDHIIEALRQDVLVLRFLERGTAKTSVEDITSRAKVGKGTFYLYFQDKGAVMQALLGRVSYQLLNDACLAVEQHPELPDFTAQVVFVIDHIIEALRQDVLVLRFLERNFVWPGLDQIEASREAEPLMRKLLAIVLSSPEMAGRSEREVYQRITALGSMCMSVCYSSILEGKPDNIDAMKPVLYDIIRRALSPEK